jgi:plasmid replication initiation protein
MAAVEVTLPDWLYRSVKARHVLTISRDYFRLRRPLDRRIYELVRKHCGAQPKWTVSLPVLHEKSGSMASTKEFRRLVRELADSNELPDYSAKFDPKADAVIFYSRAVKGAKAQIADILAGTRKPTIKRY